MELPQRWGFCMAGNEQAYCDGLDIAISRREITSHNDKGNRKSERNLDEPYIYFEIGIGNGDTMEAAAQWLGGRKIPYFIIGVDLPDYSGTGRNKGWNKIELNGKTEEVHPMNVAYLGSELFLSKIWMKANFIFIDGCHGSPCATRDFLLAEKKIKDGGVICFHDSDPNCQGQHFQAHCKMGIDVRKALEDLGLLDDSRPGWKKLFETWGDRSRSGHGAAFFQYHQHKPS